MLRKKQIHCFSNKQLDISRLLHVVYGTISPCNKYWPHLGWGGLSDGFLPVGFLSIYIFHIYSMVKLPLPAKEVLF